MRVIIYTLKDNSQEIFELHGDEEERQERIAAENELRSPGTHVKDFEIKTLRSEQVKHHTH